MDLGDQVDSVNQITAHPSNPPQVYVRVVKLDTCEHHKRE